MPLPRTPRGPHEQVGSDAVNSTRGAPAGEVWYRGL
jgi:hypothetical protein